MSTYANPPEDIFFKINSAFNSFNERFKSFDNAVKTKVAENPETMSKLGRYSSYAIPLIDNVANAQRIKNMNNLIDRTPGIPAARLKRKPNLVTDVDTSAQTESVRNTTDEYVNALTNMGLDPTQQAGFTALAKNKEIGEVNSIIEAGRNAQIDLLNKQELASTEIDNLNINTINEQALRRYDRERDILSQKSQIESLKSENLSNAINDIQGAMSDEKRRDLDIQKMAMEMRKYDKGLSETDVFDNDFMNTIKDKPAMLTVLRRDIASRRNYDAMVQYNSLPYTRDKFTEEELKAAKK